MAVRFFGRRGAAFAASLALCTIVAAPSWAQPPEGPFAEVFAQLAGRLVGVVVNVSTQAVGPAAKTSQDAPQNSPGTPSAPLDEFFRDFFGDKGGPGGSGPPRTASLGSGFIIDPAGLIVTNNHVIANAEQITVTLSDDTTMQAQVIGRDAVTDLALLKIDAKTPLPAAAWGDSAKARVGDWVLAIGNPFGLAIPAALAQPIIEQLKATGKVERGWIGARIQPMTDEIAESLGLDKNRGAMIAAVDWGSPAERAKVQPGDVILSYDGKPIERSRQLPRLVADTPPDKQVKLTIWRDGKEQEVELKAAALNPNRPAPPPPDPEKPKPPAGIEALGLKLAKLTPDLRKQFSLSDGAKGAVIIEVAQNSAGAAQGLRAGDVVVAVGRSAVANPEDFPPLVAGAKKHGRKNVLVRVEREGSSRFVALPLETS